MKPISGPASDCSRVFRGGSWFNSPSRARVANRHGNTPGSRYYDLGFRPCLSVR